MFPTLRLDRLEPREVPAVVTPQAPAGLLPTRADGIALASTGVVPPASVIRLAPGPRYFPGGGPPVVPFGYVPQGVPSFFGDLAPAPPAGSLTVSRPGAVLRPTGLQVAPPADATPTVVVLPAVYVG